MKDLKDLVEYYSLRLWVITVLLCIGAIGLVHLMALTDAL